MNLTYNELFDILWAAKIHYNHEYQIFHDEKDECLKNLCVDLIDKINQSPAMFFTIKEDDPF